MKKNINLICVIIILCVLSIKVNAATPTFTPSLTFSSTPTTTTTPNVTLTKTPTSTITATFTSTATPISVTDTATPTSSPTVTLTTTPTATESITTATPTSSLTLTFTSTATPMGVTNTVTFTPTTTQIMQPATATITPTQSAGTIQTTSTATTTATVIIDQDIPKNTAVIHSNVMKIKQKQPAKIRVNLEKSQKVTVKIYTQRGRLVKQLVDDIVDAGTFETAWDGVNRHGNVVPAGIYIVNIKTETFQQKKRVIVVR